MLANTGPQQQPMGLLGGGWQPQQGDGLLRSLVGDPRNPNDPRADALMALGSGLSRGSMSSGFDAARGVFADTEERGMRRAAQEQQLLAGRMGLTKSAMEIQSMQQAQQKQQALAPARQRMRGGQAFQALPNGSDSFGIPTVGETPLFSMGTQPGASSAMGNAGMPQFSGPQYGAGQPGAHSSRSRPHKVAIAVALGVARAAGPRTFIRA
ncbi:hypothetical protein HK414_13020 [Ramlibacter terrae]|uniref:Uncharacterized protein n=1 Tax=Ramlibacter terrae TaxID=2732511 RepID=A0ABX6P3S8_9BURK|nr:hypothetical protein HK414_13020 [Ramlibacter terrae]